MKRIIASLTFLAAAISGAQAGLVLSDSFSYPDGGIVTNSTWLPNTGTANTMLVANQQLVVTSARSEDIAGPLTGGPFPTNGTVVTRLYSSYTLKCVVRPTTLAGTYYSHFTGSNNYGLLTGHRARVYAGVTNANAGVGAGSTQFYLGIVNASGNPTNGTWATALETNVTYTVVTRYVLATGESTLWVNPSAETDPGATANDVLPYEPSGVPTNGVVNVGHYAFRQASGEGTLIIDDLKVGTSFSDVAGANTSPLISSIADQSIPASGSTGPLDFTVQDAESPATSLTVSASSDNATLLPDASTNFVFSGTSTNRTITVNPAFGQEGTANITVSVSDGVNTSSTIFTLRVGFPVISAIPGQIVYPNTSSAPISFTVGDAETPAASLTLSKASSYPGLVDPSGIVFGGSGANRTVTITPVANQTGVATITVTVSDGTSTASSSFQVTVPPSLGILLSDTFSYPDGSLWLNGPWQTHASPTGTNFGQLLVVNGTAQLSRSHAEDLAAALTGAPYYATNGVVFYTGFKIIFTELPTSSGNYFLHLKDAVDGTTFRAKVFASTANAANGQFRIGIANGANSVSAQFPMDLSLNQTYGVVTRYDSGSAETVLWVNPVSESSLKVVATDVTSPAQVGAFGLREDSGIGTNYVDNLVVSTAFADVQPGVTSPAAIALEVTKVGADTVLSWSNPAFVLQAAPLVTGTYTNVLNATSPYTVPATEEQLYFRLKY